MSIRGKKDRFHQPKESSNLMESFFILKNSSKPEKIIATINGFTLNTFLFGPFWGIFKGLWLEGLTWMLIIYITYFLAPELFFFFF